MSGAADLTPADTAHGQRKLLDTVREVHTPEGVALHLLAAGPVPRATAWLIDLILRIGLLLVVALVLGLLGSFGNGLYMIVMFSVYWGYPVVFEALYDGRTPGKRALSLRVVSADGAPIGWMASFVRNLMRAVDMLPFGYGAGLVSSLADPWSRRLGDMVAGTLVVHAPRTRSRGGTPGAAPVAPAVALRSHEQQAVIAFGERAHALGQPRQQELADILEPVSGAHGEVGLRRLLGVAEWLLGRRG